MHVCIDNERNFFFQSGKIALQMCGNKEQLLWLGKPLQKQVFFEHCYILLAYYFTVPPEQVKTPTLAHLGDAGCLTNS